MEPAAVTIQVNGQPRAVSNGTTVADLLRELEIKPDRVAVELNLEIVDRQGFETRYLEEGDRLEILSFIGGGTGSTIKDTFYGIRRARPAPYRRV
jgi:thiamine biosynthesis protein ThiS